MRDPWFDLSPRIRRKMNSLKDIPARDEFVAQKNREKFLAEAKLIKIQPVTNSTSQRHKGWKFLFLKELKMGTIATILVVIGLVLGGSTATVYAAQDDNPGEILYPVKVLSENIAEDLNLVGDDAVGFQLNIANRRIAEMLTLLDAGETIPESVFTNYQMHLNHAMTIAGGEGQGDMVRTLERIRETLRTQERLMDCQSTDPTLLRTRSLVHDRLQLVSSGVVDPAGYYNEAHNGWSDTSTFPGGAQNGNGGMNGNIDQQSSTPEPGAGNQNGTSTGAGGTQEGTCGYCTPNPLYDGSGSQSGAGAQSGNGFGK